MNKELKIALMLTAVDNMSSVFGKAVGASKDQLDKLKKASDYFRDGSALLGIGKELAGTLTPAIDAFGEAEEAGNKLKAVMMGPNGVLDASMYGRIFRMSQKWSDTYAGSASSYLDMVRVLKNNRIGEADVLGGIGEASAKLSDYFQMMPDTTAEFASHMKNDMGVANSEMNKMMDIIARFHDAGVGKSGSEAVTEMNEFFSKASLGAANLGVQGLEASKQIGALGALFMSRGLSGATVGTNFRRIFDGLRDAQKLKDANDVAAQFGVHLKLFEKGKFLGMDNFVNQLGKLEKFKPQVISAILKPFGGKQGLSTDFLEYLAKHGLSGFKEFQEKIQNQATLDQKLATIMKGVNYQQKVMGTSWQNLKATFGASMKPALDAFWSTLNKIIATVNAFLQQNPRISKFISTFIALSSAALMLFGIIKIFKGIIIVVRMLNVALAANPFILIAMVAITAISLIYTYWDKIVPFFKNLWGKIGNTVKAIIKAIKSAWYSVIAFFSQLFNAIWKVIKTTLKVIAALFLNFTPMGLIYSRWGNIVGWFKKLWNGVKLVFSYVLKVLKFLVLNFSPIGLIYNHWGGITGWFSRLWDGVKKVFSTVFDVIAFLFLNFTPQGLIYSHWGEITKWFASLWDGVKNLFNSFIEWVSHTWVGKLFSVIKDAIHGVKKLFDFASNNSLDATINASTVMANNSGFQTFMNKPTAIIPARTSNNSTVAIHAPVTVNLHGNATTADAKAVVAEVDRHFAKQMDRYNYNKKRRSID